MSNFEIVDKKAEVNTCYGLESFCITSEEINALISGKKLYSGINGDEYAITIEMEEVRGENESRPGWLPKYLGKPWPIDDTPETYICDPEKNTECKKTCCQTMCFETTDPRYQKEDK